MAAAVVVMKSGINGACGHGDPYKPVLEAYLGDFIAARRTQVICRWST